MKLATERDTETLRLRIVRVLTTPFRSPFLTVDTHRGPGQLVCSSLYQSRGVVQHPSHTRCLGLWNALLKHTPEAVLEFRPLHISRGCASNLHWSSSACWRQSTHCCSVRIQPCPTHCSAASWAFQCRSSSVHEVTGSQSLWQHDVEMVCCATSQPVPCHVLRVENFAEHVCLWTE